VFALMAAVRPRPGSQSRAARSDAASTEAQLRRLLVTHRTVSPECAGEYETAWRDLEKAMTAAGANAWRFQHASVAGRYLEFVEWKGDMDPTATAAAETAMAGLQVIAPGATETWTEAEVST
jgi:hypothetical protein